MSCYALSKSVYCPDYVGSHFKAFEYGDIKEVPISIDNNSFDSAIETSLRFHYDYLEKCNRKNSNDTIPMYSTWLCAAIAEKSQSCTNAPKPLCSRTCFKFLEEYNDYTSSCSESSKIIQIKTDIMNFCEKLVIRSPPKKNQCIKPSNARKSCGLRSFSDICKNCNREACDAATITKTITKVNDTVKAADDTGATAKYNTSTRILIIAAVVIGCFLLFVLLLLGLHRFYKWWRTKRIWKKAEHEKNRYDDIQVSPKRTSAPSPPF